MRRLIDRVRGRLEVLFQSDELFIQEAYQRILGRPVDPDGFKDYRAAMRHGLSRIDFLLALAHSDERTNTLAKAPRAKSSPRAMCPERYRELVDRTNGQIVSVFEAGEPEDFDWLEARLFEVMYYERPGVWNFEVDLDKRVVAEIVGAFNPKRALELGCAAGAVIDCLLEYGVDAEGIDVSEMAIHQASDRARRRIYHGDLLNLGLLGQYDVVFGLDVFEHLNPNRLRAYIEQLTRLVATSGHIFCNIPAFGRDAVFGTVFPYYIDGWEKDAHAGRPFSRLHVDTLGYPLHGHLTWADTAWWVEQFTSVGLTREFEIERAIHAKYDGYMRAITPARRAFFVFAKLPSLSQRAAILERIREQPSRQLAEGAFAWRPDEQLQRRCSSSIRAAQSIDGNYGKP